MTFSSGQDMYDILDSGDIYNPEKELYVFLYNDAGAVCAYNVSKYEAKELELKSKESGEYWSAFLGVGGSIYDEPMEFCDANYNGNWYKV